MNWQQRVPLGAGVRARAAKIRIGVRSVCEAVTSPDSFPKSTQPSDCLSPILEKDRRGMAVAGVSGPGEAGTAETRWGQSPQVPIPPTQLLEDWQPDLYPVGKHLTESPLIIQPAPKGRPKDTDVGLSQGRSPNVPKWSLPLESSLLAQSFRYDCFLDLNMNNPP